MKWCSNPSTCEYTLCMGDPPGIGKSRADYLGPQCQVGEPGPSPSQPDEFIQLQFMTWVCKDKSGAYGGGKALYWALQASLRITGGTAANPVFGATCACGEGSGQVFPGKSSGCP